MRKIFSESGWEDYLYWQEQNKKILQKINRLLKDIDRNPLGGIGKPEPLKGNYSGYWSRRIDEANRLIYRISQDIIEIHQCKGHYDDK
ncbi:Txe/YoeB family addiction module toxin [Spirochaetia bacterium]|nr:Txe/YoeB family addiction module toxin [Spirochaetia bacterium]